MTNECFKYLEGKNLCNLKDNKYIGEKTSNNGYIYINKSRNKIKEEKIYKIVFDNKYLNRNDYDVGFGSLNL